MSFRASREISTISPLVTLGRDDIRLLVISTVVEKSKEIMSKQYYTYILANKTDTTLYIGVTNNLERRVVDDMKSEGD